MNRTSPRVAVQQEKRPNAAGPAPADVRRANVIHDRAVGLARSKRYDEAIAGFREALGIDPSRANTWRNLALAYTHSGRPFDAEPCYAKAAALQPSSLKALLDWARVLRRLRRFGQAAEQLTRAIALDPSSPEAHMDLGLTLAELDRPEQAKQMYLRALAIKPEYAEALNNLGVLCQHMGALDEAAEYLRRSARLEPRAAGAHNNLGVVLAEQRRFEEAIECYHRALAIDPGYVIAWNNLGNALRTLGRCDEAIAALERAIAMKPDYAEAANNLAITYLQKADPERALAYYDRAMMLRPDYAEAHMNRALAWLGIGELQKGWADYEWRWRLKSLRDKHLAGVRWDGGCLLGKRVLVRYEQGLGDTFHFVRYLAHLKERGATVIFEGKPETRAILSRTLGIDQYVEKGSKLPEYDYWTCLLSLPGHFGTTLDNVPAPIPYIHPDPALCEQWREAMGRLPVLKVGVAWQGNPQHRGDRQRSVPLRQFATIAKVEDVSLVSLQRGFGSEQIEQLGGDFKVETFAGVLEDADGFLRTAAILKNLDLVVTIDSAVAHLAGAMGVPVWIALPLAADWRWLRDREDSPWYPTVRLFRQCRAGDWTDVFDRITAALRERLASEPTNAEHAISRDPETARAARRDGGRLIAEGKLVEARQRLEVAVAADPLDADAHHDLGVALAKQGLRADAIARFRRALELQPSAAGTHANLGLAFLHNDQINESASHLRRAIALGGGTADVHNNLGIALTRLCRPADAADSYLRALYVKPDYAAAHYNLARVLLLQGQFAQGWLEYEWRAKCLPGCDRAFDQPRWAGEDLSGKTILLWGEQGLGDTIQFVRYARAVRRYNPDRILVECQPPLAPLLSRCLDVDEVLPAAPGTGRRAPRFDVQAPLMSLPAILGMMSADQIPAAVPYVFADESACAAWKRRIADMRGLRVGIAWQGNPRHGGDRQRSVPLGLFEPLARVEGVALVSLQCGYGSEQAERSRCPFEVHTFPNLESGEDGFERTAAILKNLDLVITVDTAVAHLAGAMGLPTWVALPAAPDWRWLLGRTDSPWYPTVRLFRQRRPGDWAEVFDRLAHELSARAATACSEPTERWAAQHRHGRRLLERGQIADAIEALGRAAAERPDVAAVHQDWGVALARSGRTDAAIAEFRKAIELDSDQIACHANLLLALLRKGDYAAAVEAGRAAVAAAPDSADLRTRLGTALVRAGRPAEAVEHMAAATRLRPGSAETHVALGDAHRAAGNPDAAEASYREAMRLRPDSFEARRELAALDARRGRHDNAVEALRRLAAERPGDAAVNAALGLSLLRLGRAGEAAESLQRAVYARPRDAVLHTHLAEALLLGGDFARGWLEYEWRWRPGGPATDRQRRAAKRKSPAGRRWAGEPLAGRSLLVTAEPRPQDMLLFSRFAALARRHGVGKLVIEAQEELIPLLSASGHFDRVVVPGAADRLGCDLHCPAGSLPLALGFTSANEAIDLPALSTSPEAQDRARSCWGKPHRPRIGVGLADDPDSRLRELQRRLLNGLSLRGADLLCFKQDRAAPDVPSCWLSAVGPDGWASTWEGIAASAQAVELVLATDPLTAQLAGAVGVPTFLWLLNGTGDWCWCRNAQGRSVFSPTVHVFRQDAAMSSADVLHELMGAIAAWLDSASAKLPRLLEAPSQDKRNGPQC